MILCVLFLCGYMYILCMVDTFARLRYVWAYVTDEKIYKNLSNTCWSRMYAYSFYSLSNVWWRRRGRWRRECCGVPVVYRLMMIYFFAAFLILSSVWVRVCRTLFFHLRFSVPLPSFRAGIVSHLLGARIFHVLFSRCKVLKLLIIDDAICYCRSLSLTLPLSLSLDPFAVFSLHAIICVQLTLVAEESIKSKKKTHTNKW